MNQVARNPSGKITLQLKVGLRDTDPLVWRQLLVPGSITLETLHFVIQAAMGWEDRHEHAFEIYGKRYSLMNFESEEDLRDLEEDGVWIHLVLGEGDLFTYEYDFGDTWLHDIEVENVEEVVTPMRQAVCLDGAMACPPEDSGGPRRYADFLTAMADPDHDEHNALRDWFGGSFDPEEFSLGNANARIQHIRPR